MGYHDRMELYAKTWTPEEKKLARCRAVGLAAIDTCAGISAIEAFFLCGFGVLLGFDAINTPFFWTEVALSLVTLVMSFLTLICAALGFRPIIVAFLVLVLPRFTVPVIFLAISTWEEMHSHPFYVWSAIAVTVQVLYCVGIFCGVLRFYLQFGAIKTFKREMEA